MGTLAGGFFPQRGRHPSRALELVPEFLWPFCSFASPALGNKLSSKSPMQCSNSEYPNQDGRTRSRLPCGVRRTLGGEKVPGSYLTWLAVDLESGRRRFPLTPLPQPGLPHCRAKNGTRMTPMQRVDADQQCRTQVAHPRKSVESASSAFHSWSDLAELAVRIGLARVGTLEWRRTCWKHSSGRRL